MLLSRCAIALAITLPAMTFFQVRAMAQQNAPPASCQVTLPSPGDVPAIAFGIGTEGRVGVFGTDALWTVLPMDGTWRGFLPTKADDYAYSNKLPWGGTFSYQDGPLIVTGRRLDGPAPAFTEIEPISWEREFMGGINIPLFGCWEVTGKYKDQELRFVVWVTPIQQQSTTISHDLEPRSAPRRVRLASEIESESLVYRVAPQIPHEAHMANISGTVVLRAVIGVDGRPHDLQYVSGPSLLTQAAIQTVTWWQYRINYQTMEVETTIPVVFPPSGN